MNPEEHREFRDDVDEESWVDREMTIEGRMKEIVNLTANLKKMIDERYTRQVPMRKVFENEAVEDLEIEEMNIARADELNNH